MSKLEQTVLPWQDQPKIRYVWPGGYPRRRDGRRPDYLETMKRTVEMADGFPFLGMAAKWREDSI